MRGLEPIPACTAGKAVKQPGKDAIPSLELVQVLFVYVQAASLPRVQHFLESSPITSMHMFFMWLQVLAPRALTKSEKSACAS